jgi:hypothetical protein
VSIEMIGPVLTSMATPLSTTVIKSAKSWLSNKIGTTLAISDRSGKVEVRNISKKELEKLAAAASNSSQPVSVDNSRASAIPGNPPTRRANPAKLDAANVVTQSQQIVVSPVFKLVFLTVVALTILSGAIAVVVAFVGKGEQPNQQALFESMNTAWKLGLGAIFCLLGGKAA